MTLADEVSAVADLMADARRLGDRYVSALASYGRSEAGATSTGSRSMKVTAFDNRDRADLAYAAFVAALHRLADLGPVREALALHDTILRLSAEAQRVAIVRTCALMRESN